MKTSILLKGQDNVKQEFDWGTLTWFSSRILGNSDEMTIGKCVIYPGRNNPLHSHPNCSEILTVIEGTITHLVEDNKEVEMHTGDTITLPPGLKHYARNIGDDKAVLYVAFPTADREVKGE